MTLKECLFLVPSLCNVKVYNGPVYGCIEGWCTDLRTSLTEEVLNSPVAVTKRWVEKDGFGRLSFGFGFELKRVQNEEFRRLLASVKD